ncbi:MAG: outer membrane beta-barrel protein [Pseudomonadales bacterium]
MKKTCAALLCLALPGLAFASEPRYSYVEGGYQYVDLDDLNVDGDGWFVGGSLGVTERVHLLAAYSDVGLDFGIDVSTLTLGVGGNLPIERSVHLVGEVGYVRTDIDTRFTSFDDDGLFVSGGIRWMTTDQVELAASVNYVNLDDAGSDTSFSAGIRFHVTPDLALTANVNLGDDATGYAFGIRYYFPGL